MWRDHIAAFQAMDLERALFVLALVMLIDVTTGFTRWFSKVLKMERQRDAVLLSLILLLMISSNDLKLFPLGLGLGLRLADTLALARNDQEKIELVRQVWLFHLDSWLIQSIAVGSALSCALLAWRQKRSAPLWLVLGYFGNLGSIVWLLAARSQPRWRDILLAGCTIAGVALPLYLFGYFFVPYVESPLWQVSPDKGARITAGREMRGPGLDDIFYVVRMGPNTIIDSFQNRMLFQMHDNAKERWRNGGMEWTGANSVTVSVPVKPENLAEFLKKGLGDGPAAEQYGPIHITYRAGRCDADWLCR